MKFTLLAVVVTAAVAFAGGIAVARHCPAMLSCGSAAAPAAKTSSVNPAEPVVVVNAQTITLRHLEDEMLRREGADTVEDLVHEQLEKTAWSKLEDPDVIVAIAGWQMRRSLLAAQLLRSSAGKVREELINIALVQQALEREGVTIDQPMVDAEIARMERKLHEGLAERKQPQVDFKSFIQQTQKMPLDQFVKQPGFTMLVGVHALAQRRAVAALDEATLRKYFDEHHDDYRIKEAVDLSTIYIPYQTAKDADGHETVSEGERIRLLEVMKQLHKGLAGGVSFAQTFHLYSRSYEAHAKADGRIGWVDRAGGRDAADARPIPLPVVERAFAVADTVVDGKPILLEPIVHDDGIDIVQVHGRRATVEPEYAAVSARIRNELIENQIEARTQSVLDELRRTSTIDYVSLPELIRKREEDAGIDKAAVDPQAAGADATPGAQQPPAAKP